MVAVALVVLQQFRLFSTQLTVPFLKSWRPDLEWHWMGSIPHLGLLAFLPFVLFVIFVLMGSSNAVNLTDGLDGLAIGCTIIAAGALAVLTYVSGHVVFADYLELQRMPMVAELTVFCGSMVGASIGFLWYNAHPAEIFMGDVGSLALGGAIGTVAIIIRQELLLPFIGGIFIIEARLCDAAGRQLQAAQQEAHLQDGSAASSFRAVGLGRVQDHRPLLDWRVGVCIVCTHYAETALNQHRAARGTVHNRKAVSHFGHSVSFTSATLRHFDDIE